MGRFASCLLVFGCLALTGVASAQTVPMTNDDCSSAIPVFTGINPSAPAGLSGNVFTNASSAEPLSIGSPAPCGSGANSDVWFIYTASANGIHTFGTCTPSGFAAGTHTDTILQVLDAGVCPPVLSLGCDDDSCTSPNFASMLSVTLTSGTSYYVRVASWSGATDGSFYLSIAAPTPPPANDECTAPIAVFDGVNPAAPSGSSGVTYSNASATTSIGVPAACASIGRDVWFSYTASFTGSLVLSTCTPLGFSAGTLSDSVVQVLDSNTCPPTTIIGCNDDSCGTLSNVTIPVTTSTTYLIRVGAFSTGSGGTFYLTATPAPLPPANDDCGGAVAIVEGVNGPFNNAFATNSAAFTTPLACQAGAGHPGSNDVFFTYTAVCNGTVDVATCDPIGFTGTNQDTQITAYPASDCPGPPSAPLDCNDDAGCGVSGFQSSITFPVTGGSSYLVRVASWGTGGGTFDVTVTRHTASNSQIGPGCSDGGGPGPVLDIDGPPVICANRNLSITGAAPGATGMLMFSVPGTPTGLTGGCALYLNQGSINLLFFVGVDAFGNWGSPITVPCDPALECATFTVQGFLFPPSPPPFYQVTSGLSVTLGY